VFTPRNVVLSNSRSAVFSSNFSFLTKRFASDFPPARVSSRNIPRNSAPRRSSESESLLPSTNVAADAAEGDQDYGTVPEEDDLNLEDTFWFMKHRQWSRMYRSSYSNKQPRGYFRFVQSSSRPSAP
jgi:hypothetical protein